MGVCQKKNGLRNHILISVGITLLASFGLYQLFNFYLIRQAEQHIQDLLLAQKGMHLYIQQVMLPALAKYKEEGALAESFYAPELFSSSYIVRNQHQLYNEERQRAGLANLYYKLAAKNPRNPINRADSQEEELIDRFNRDRSLTKVKAVIEVNGEKFLNLAIPFLENNGQCLVCHGKREDAPLELQRRYPGEGGFNETVGEIRAITSIRAPLHEQNHLLTAVLGALTLGSITFLTLVITNQRLAKKVDDSTALLRQNENYLRAIQNSMAVGFLLIDTQSRTIVDVNPGALAIIKRPRHEVVGKTCFDCLFAQEKTQCPILDLGQAFDHSERVLLDGQGQSVPILKTVVGIGINGKQYLIETFVDISALKRMEREKAGLEARLNQAQKMEAIGTLAGGIAHDFNNILSVILGYASMAQEDAEANSRLYKDLERVLAAGERAKELVKQILAFSRHSQVDRMTLCPQPIIKESLKMMRSAIPSTIAIVDAIANDCGCLDADPTQLHQILMNLCTNAYHAMEDGGGTLTVELKTADRLPIGFASDQQRPAHEFMELTVSDTGTGIDPSIREKIFDPFFTTKEVGKGTGMGLSITYGIVHDYGGAIEVESELGKGTTFHLYFPKSVSAPEPTVVEAAALPHGRERILLVDDEELIVEMNRYRLKKLGYEVVSYQSSREALDAFRADPDHFDLVITDQTMPELTGLELASQILALRPGLPIILCTGFSTQVTEELALAQGVRAFTIKPTSNQVLATLVRQVLDEPKAEG